MTTILEEARTQSSANGSLIPFPCGVDNKFERDGTVRYYPGNTIISHLPAESPLYRALLALYDELSSSEYSNKYTLLPPTSWHMTVFEGVCDEVRKVGFWPAALPIDAPLAACNDLYAQKLADFRTLLDLPLRIKVTDLTIDHDGIGLRLIPADSIGERSLRDLRDRLAKTTGLSHPIHETYEFHLGIAYLFEFLPEQGYESIRDILRRHLALLPPQFELGAPAFCTFNNMFHFQREFELQS